MTGIFEEGPIRRRLREKGIIKRSSSPEIMGLAAEHMAAALVRDLDGAITTSKILQTLMPSGEPTLFVVDFTRQLIELRDRFIKVTHKWRKF